MMELVLKIVAADATLEGFRRVVDNSRAMQAAIRGEQVQTTQTAMQQTAAVGESMLKAGAAGALMGKPIIRAFTELEDSSVRLKSVMMDNTGKISKNFDELNRQSFDLGNRLPGTTANFYDLTSGMLALGLSQQTMVAGGLKSAAYLGVLTRQFGEDYKEAGMSVAKFKEALGISDGDLIKFMDTVQRLRHLGMPLNDMRFAFARMGGELKSLGIQGLQAANDIVPLAAYIYKTGASGQVTGSSMNSLMRQLAMMPLIESKKVFQNQAQPILQNYGIKLKFVDDQGRFLGVENMVQQMDKLRKLTALERSLVINAMVGAGGDASAMKFLVGMGTKGYADMQKQLSQQANLETRVQSVLKTQSNAWDALEGTFRNFLALLGEGMAPALKSLEHGLNNVVTKVIEWTTAHPKLSEALMTGGFALTGFLLVGGSMSFALGKAIPFLTNFGSQLMGVGKIAVKAGQDVMLYARAANATFVAPAARNIGAALSATAPGSMMQSGAGRIAGAAFGMLPTRMFPAEMNLPPSTSIGRGLSGIASGFGTITRGVGMMNLALITSPAFWVISALAIGAILIIRNWETVKAFFGGMGAGLKAAFAEPWKALQGLRDAFAPILPILGGAFRFIVALFAPVQATSGQLQKAASWGVVMGQFIGTAARVVVTPLIWVITLVGHLMTFLIRTATGGNLLGRMMVSAFTVMVAPILMVWNLLRAFFKGVMALFDGKTWMEAGKIAVESLWSGMLEIFGKVMDGIKGVADKVMGFFGMSKKDGAAQTAEKAANTAQTATSTPKPPPTPPPPAPKMPDLPPMPAAPRIPQASAPKAPRRLVVTPSVPDTEQLERAANRSATMPSGVSALETEQIASSMMDIPRVSYQEPPRIANQPRTMRTALMGGKYPSGKLVAPAMQHEFEGQTYMSTPLDMGTTSKPKPPREAREPKEPREPKETKVQTTTIAPEQPFTFNFTFNVEGGAAGEIAKDIQRILDDKLPDITRAIKESINSSRLNFSY